MVAILPRPETEKRNMTKNTRTILAATFAADGTITQEQADAALKVLAGKGNAAGAVCVQHEGGASHCPTLAEIEELLGGSCPREQ